MSFSRSCGVFHGTCVGRISNFNVFSKFQCNFKVSMSFLPPVTKAGFSLFNFLLVRT